MEERQDYKVFWVVAFSLLLLTRIPAMANYLSIDNVNLAFSLDKFDPRVHQPQPPGYPFFVLLGKISCSRILLKIKFKSFHSSTM